MLKGEAGIVVSVVRTRPKWIPARKTLGAIPAQSEPLIKLPKTISDLSIFKTNTIADILIGAVLGGAPYLVMGMDVCDKAGEKLAWGLGLTGLLWAITGKNYLGISGGATALGFYGACKWKESSTPVLEIY